MSADPNEVAKLFPLEPAWPDDKPGRLGHNPYSDIWARHASGGKRDPEADREVRDAIEREAHGEYDSDGNFQPSAWGPA